MKICYVSFKLDNPRDRITVMGLKENGVEVKELGFNGYCKLLKDFRNLEPESDLVMIGYASSILIIFLRFFTRKRIIYNALATFYDSMVISRGANLVRYWLIDFLAFSLADKVFLECQSQKDLVVKIFRINPDKISVHFVGTDDKQFYFDPAIAKLKQFTVVFRGMFLPEAGAEVVVRAAKELEQEDIKIRIIGRGLLLKEIEKLIDELKPKNLELVTTRLPIDELRQKMTECHLSLGQLANHPRVHTTIPHKVFESMAMKLPYLTGENKGVMEFLADNQTCFTVPPGGYRELARKIVELRGHPKELEQVAEHAYQLYQQEFTPKILARKVINEIAPQFLTR
ncbi:MAG: glycosyltransferase [bacterium]|nr:glycosyltransferase [bacterium]